MDIEILCTDSLGVRSMSTFVRGDENSYLIDPGVSLAPRRFGLPPHPEEIDASRKSGEKIEKAALKSNIIIITHYHHDHFTPFYEHEFNSVSRGIYDGKKVYLKSWTDNINQRQKERANKFVEELTKRRVPFDIADGKKFGEIEFSPAFPHGEKGRGIFVIMVAIKTSSGTFIHGSDIQLIEDEPVEWILSMKPDILFVSGPPVYLQQLPHRLIEQAEKNILRLAEKVPATIIDHHIARSDDCSNILKKFKNSQPVAERKNKIMLAYEYMKVPPQFLEASRKNLYHKS